MSADDKEPYFDGPHMSTSGQQPSCSSITNQRQAGQLQYNSVTSSQVHNHMMNPTSMPFFYNPSQYTSGPSTSTWQPQVKDGAILPVTNGDLPQEVNQYESSSSASSSHHNSPEKSNLYANMPPPQVPTQAQQVECSDDHITETTSSYADSSTPAIQLQSQMESSSMPDIIFQPQPPVAGQYLSPDDSTLPTPSTIFDPPRMNMAEWNEGTSQQAAGFGSYMNMANNPAPNAQLEQQFHEQQAYHQPAFQAESNIIPNQGEALQPVADEGLALGDQDVDLRQQNFSSDHLHRDYAENSQRHFDDILHSQGTWQSGRGNQNVNVYGEDPVLFNPDNYAANFEVMAAPNMEHNQDIEIPAEMQEVQLELFSNQQSNNLENPEADLGVYVSDDVVEQVQSLNISQPDDEIILENISVASDENLDHSEGLFSEEQPCDDETHQKIELSTITSPPEDDEAVSSPMHDIGEDATIAHEAGDINLHPCSSKDHSNEAEVLSTTQTVNPFWDAGQSSNPTIHDIPPSSHESNEPPADQSKSIEKPTRIGIEQTEQDSPLPLQQPAPVTVSQSSTDTNLTEQTLHMRKHSIGSNSSHRSVGSQKSYARSSIAMPDPPSLLSSTVPSVLTVKQTKKQNGTHTMHSSYVSVQQKTQSTTVTTYVVSAPSTDTLPEQPVLAAPGPIPQSLHSQMLPKKSVQGGLPAVPPITIPEPTGSQHSYNDMHASSSQLQTQQTKSIYYDNHGRILPTNAESVERPVVTHHSQNERHPPKQQPPGGVPPSRNSNQSSLHTETQHPMNSQYAAQLENQSYVQSPRYFPDNERAPPRPHSRSSITAGDGYNSYRPDRYEQDDRAPYNRPHSRQGHAKDRVYPRQRYPNEYDEYYDRRNAKEDYYYYGRQRDYRDYNYQGYGDYYQRRGNYGDYYRDDVYQAQDGNYYRRSDYYGSRNHENWQYKNESYNQDYQQQYYNRRRYPDEDDGRSIHSERSMHHNDADRSLYPQHGDAYNESYQDPYRKSQYYGEYSLNDTTFSNTYNEDTWEQLPQAVLQRRTPAKFNTAHPIARFGAGGHLIHVLPHLPSENQPAVVEIHSVETLLQDCNSSETFRSYPGPLSKEETHKNDVLRYVAGRSSTCMKSIELMDRTSAALMWDFLGLLVRQNGSILGTDVAELLMKDHSGDFGLMASPNEAHTSHVSAVSTASGDEVENAEVATTSSSNRTTCPSFRFRELLLYGRKKDALEWAMKSNLWGHALLLASKTDARTHANVMLRFANSLPINDPLQTLYQQMSGRQPAAATCLVDEGWGDWRPHLAMILSNATNNVTHDAKIAMTMGDTLVAKGLLDAAHFCYLMASAPLGYYSRKTNKLVLIGSNQNLPFDEFSSDEAIRRSETYEYAISLGTQARHKGALLPSLQIFKFIYACRLMECGMIEKAFHYCELIAKLICRSPKSYSVTLVSQLANVVGLLQNHDRRLQAGTLLSSDLQWIERLSNITEQMQGGSIVPQYATTPSITATTDEPSTSTSRSTPDQQIESPRSMLEETDGMVEPVSEPNHHYLHPQYDQTAPYGQAEPETQLPPMDSAPSVPMYGAQVPTFNPQQVPQNSYQPPPMQEHRFQHHQPHQQLQNDVIHQTNPLANLALTPSQPFVPQATQQPDQYQHMVPQSDAQNYPDPGHLTHASEPVTDYYDQVSAVRAASRIRTTSQNSHASHRSHASSRRHRLDSKRSRSSGRRSRTVSENSRSGRSRSASGESEKQGRKSETKDSKSGWFFGLFGNKKKEVSHKVQLPKDDEKEIVWDPEKKRWINKNEPEEEQVPLAPPPIDNSAPSTAPQPSTGLQQTDGASPPAGLTPNKFSLKNMSGRAMYKNAFSSSTNTSDTTVAPPQLFPMAPQTDAAPAMFIPKPVPTNAPQDAPAPQSQPTNQQNPQPEQFQQQPLQHQGYQQPQQMEQHQQQPYQQQEQHQQQQQQLHNSLQQQQQQQQPVSFYQPQQSSSNPAIFNNQAGQMAPPTSHSVAQPPAPAIASEGGGAFTPVVPRNSQGQTAPVEPTAPNPSLAPAAAPPAATFYNPASFSNPGVNPFSQPPAPTGGTRGGPAKRGRGGRPSYPSKPGFR